MPLFFYKSQLFSSNHKFFPQNCNFFPQIATIFYILPTFCTILKLFSTILQIFLQFTTFFYKSLLLSANGNFFYVILNFFIHYYNFSNKLQPAFARFSTLLETFFHKSQTFSAILQLFPTEEMSKTLVWIKEKSVISFISLPHGGCLYDS